MELEVAIEGAREAHASLLSTLTALSDDVARQPSRLPDWSVGHVLTHIARNGDSFTRMLRAAIDGQSVQQYADGVAGRADAIEAGAGRPAAELVDDVATSISGLERTWEAMSPQAWQGSGVNSGGVIWPCVAMPFHRWREVALHHVDLGLGYTTADLPEAYVARELALSLDGLPQRLDVVNQRALLGWLVGRDEQPSDLAIGPWQAPPDQYPTGS